VTALQVGAEAPDFELRDQHGQRVRLSSFRGSKSVVLVFFPSAFSPVCSSELSTLRKSWPELDRPDVELVTVSCDPLFTLRAYSDQEGIEFRMLTDFWPHGTVSVAYDVFDRDFGCSKRSTFVIDPDGRVRWLVHNAMPDARNVQEYANALDSLRSG
jgi:peroxiredoxin